MNAWWWVSAGLVAWFAVSLAAALWLGPVLRRCSQARETLEARMGEMPAGLREPRQHWQQAS
jgi:HAMP domain-containing protein